MDGTVLYTILVGPKPYDTVHLLHPKQCKAGANPSVNSVLYCAVLYRTHALDLLDLPGFDHWGLQTSEARFRADFGRSDDVG